MACSYHRRKRNWSIKFDLCKIIGYILFQDDVISCTLFFSAFFILRTSMTRTTIAIKRPKRVQINTPPSDRSVMPSESSKIGQSLLFVLFQYFPNNSCQLKHFRPHFWNFSFSPTPGAGRTTTRMQI